MVLCAHVEVNASGERYAKFWDTTIAHCMIYNRLTYKHKRSVGVTAQRKAQGCAELWMAEPMKLASSCAQDAGYAFILA